MNGPIRPAEPPSREKYLELSESFILAREKFNAEELHALLDFNVLLTIIGEQATIYPFRNRYFGQDAVIDLITAFRTSFKCTGDLILDRLVDGDRVVVLHEAILVHRATGKAGSVIVSEWFRFRLGRIVEIRLFCDGEALRKLLDE